MCWQKSVRLQTEQMRDYIARNISTFLFSPLSNNLKTTNSNKKNYTWGWKEKVYLYIRIIWQSFLSINFSWSNLFEMKVMSGKNKWVLYMLIFLLVSDRAKCSKSWIPYCGATWSSWGYLYHFFKITQHIHLKDCLKKIFCIIDPFILDHFSIEGKIL